MTTKRRRKFILKNNLSKFCFYLLKVNLSISRIINSLNPLYFIYRMVKCYQYSFLVSRKYIKKQLSLIFNLNNLISSAFASSYFQLYLFNASSIIENITVNYFNYISL